MKHPMDDRFTYVRKDRFRYLLDYLLRNYKGLYPKVAPEGFEKSPYHSVYATTVEAAYLEYRRGRAKFYKLSRSAKVPYEVEPLLNLQDFIEKRWQQNPDADLAGFYLYVECLERILDHRIIVHDDNFFCFGRDDEDFEEYMLKATKRILPQFAIVFDDDKFHGRRYNYLRIDLTPIYEYIFQLLKAKNLNCIYTVLDEKDNEALDDMLEKVAIEAEIQRILKENTEDQHPDPETLQSDIEEYNTPYLNIERSKTSTVTSKYDDDKTIKNPVVEAYHNVYGKLMENYPYRWM